jgi:hypothetical protein
MYFSESTVKGTVMTIAEKLAHFNTSACCMPQMLIDAHKIARKATTSNLLH